MGAPRDPWHADHHSEDGIDWLGFFRVRLLSGSGSRPATQTPALVAAAAATLPDAACKPSGGLAPLPGSTRITPAPADPASPKGVGGSLTLEFRSAAIREILQV